MRRLPAAWLDGGMDPIDAAGRANPHPNGSIGAAPMRGVEAITVVAALRAALQTGLLDALDRWSPCAPDELAARTHLTARAVELTLRALETGGIVTRTGDVWSPVAPAASWSAMHDFADHIVTYVETGVPSAHLGAGRYVAPLRVIGGFMQPLVDATVPHLVQPGVRILELGAGTAPWSRALLTAEPSGSAVAVDLAPVADDLRTRLAAEGTTAIECVAGDVLTVTLGARTEFDVVVVSGLCRLLDAADNERLLTRCAAWLAPGGRVVLCDAFADTDDADGSLALYALGLAARSNAETLWSYAHYERWLADAGFRPATVVTRARAGHAVAIARRA